MLESKEKSTHRLPVPLPKTKHGVIDDVEEEETTGEQVGEELGDDIVVDEAPRGHMHP